MPCMVCNEDVTNNDFKKCVRCSKSYHTLCIDFSHADTQGQEPSINWTCPQCLSKQPRSDNSNIPVRPSTPTSMADVTFNVTRRKMTQSRLDTLQLDPSTESLRSDIREIIREEMRNALQDTIGEIKVSISANLKEINDQISAFKDSMNFLSDEFDKLKQDNITYRNEIKQLKKENEMLHYDLSEVKGKFINLDQLSRASNIEIQCVPEYKSENVINIVKQIGRTYTGTEFLHVALSSQSIGTQEDLHIIVVYIPPDISSIPLHLNSIGQAITDTLALIGNHNFILIGDFNLPCLTWIDEGFSISSNCSLQMRTAAASLADDLNILGFSQYNLITNTNNRILDLCFSTVPLTVSRCDDPLLPEDSHHPALDIMTTELFLFPLEETHVIRRNYYKGDYKELNKYFNKIDWIDKLSVNSVDVAIKSFYNEVKLGVDSFIPLIDKSKSHKYPVWYSRSLIKIIREKTKVHKRWKKYGNPRDYYEFTLLRSRQRNVEASSFKHHIAQTEKAISYSPKAFWAYVKGKRGGSQYPKTMTLSNMTLETGPDICTAFNNYFHSVFVSLSTPTAAATNTPNVVNGSADVICNLDITIDTVLKALRIINKTISLSMYPNVNALALPVPNTQLSILMVLIAVRSKGLMWSEILV
ncbi:hypothetical protein HF086_017792 [Spodoptera exigua]|uniref:PHD-type domain-containing protein n=1 Tax=Spodoptera exigua TaxID=7107 RepID=A0A922MJG1_SPOEX|nr:hypothetical protein HF086_017792 [Spodoptera exigua]